MLKNLFKNNSSETVSPSSIDKSRLPRHVAIIMDGNGRWAKKLGMVRTAGHRAGMSTLKQILKTANDIGIKVLTVYAFSTENWKRPATEVDFLMSLFSEYLAKELSEMHEMKVRINFIGHREELSLALQKQMQDAEALTTGNTGICFNIAANYGGRAEILRATQNLVKKVKSGQLNAEDIDETAFDRELYTADNPPVDLLIRTGGDMRISNFLLWQTAYAEFWFTAANWPEFTADLFMQALSDFASRERRFGGV